MSVNILQLFTSVSEKIIVNEKIGNDNDNDNNIKVIV